MSSLILMFALVVAPPMAGDAGAAGPGETVVAEVNEAADRLRTEAFRLFEDRRSWTQAARLLERSGELREAGDPARVDAFLVAGRIYAHTGALAAAQRAFEKAGDSAARIGAVSEAAAAYLDAALSAIEREEPWKARELVEKAALLARSPHLESFETLAILKRIPAGYGNG